MEAVIDFLRAALPWILIGVFFAVALAKHVGKKESHGEKLSDDDKSDRN